MSLSLFSRQLDSSVENAEELAILRGTTRYVEQRSLLSNRSQEVPRSQPALVYTYPSPMSTPFGTIESSEAAAMSESATSPELLSAASSGSRESVFSRIIKTRGVDSLLGPSPLCQAGVGDKNKAESASSSSDCGAETCADQYDNYLPPFVEPRRGKTGPTPTGLSAAETSTGSISPAQAIGEQNRPAGLWQGQTSQSTGPSAPSLSTTPDPFTFPGLSTQGHTGRSTDASGATNIPNPFWTGQPQMFSLFDPPLDPTDGTNPFFTNFAPDPQTIADLNALYQQKDDKTVEAWNSLMQQFELVNSGNAGYDSWEAMVFS